MDEKSIHLQNIPHCATSQLMSELSLSVVIVDISILIIRSHSHSFRAIDLFYKISSTANCKLFHHLSNTYFVAWKATEAHSFLFYIPFNSQLLTCHSTWLTSRLHAFIHPTPLLLDLSTSLCQRWCSLAFVNGLMSDSFIFVGMAVCVCVCV